MLHRLTIVGAKLTDNTESVDNPKVHLVFRLTIVLPAMKWDLVILSVAKAFSPASSTSIAEVGGAATRDVATPIRTLDDRPAPRTRLPVFIVCKTLQVSLQSCLYASFSRMSPILACETHSDATHTTSHVCLASV
jgi:hypothetical protein